MAVFQVLTAVRSQNSIHHSRLDQTAFNKRSRYGIGRVPISKNSIYAKGSLKYYVIKEGEGVSEFGCTR